MTFTTDSQTQQLITTRQNTQEYKRLVEDQKKEKYWKRWGPYVSDRQWGTVREDYLNKGWDGFPHDHARSRAYRWGEDGIAGICDNHQRLCFAIALWNEQDSILKERLYGLTGAGSDDAGNHGEDVKEYYFYLANTPTHSYMKCLYKYPHAKYPYFELKDENKNKLNQSDPEFELLDTKVFEENRYFDVFVEYAKGSPEDTLIQITVTNRGSEQKTLRLLPTIWFRNTWSWGVFNIESRFQTDLDNGNFSADLKKVFENHKIVFSQNVKVEIKKPGAEWLIADEEKKIFYTVKSNNQQLTVYQEKPSLKTIKSDSQLSVIEAYCPERPQTRPLEKRWLYCEKPDEVLYTENETNVERFEWGTNASPYVKDGINDYIVDRKSTVNPNPEGTKASGHYKLNMAPGETKIIRLRLTQEQNLTDPFGSNFETVFKDREQEANDYYQAINPFPISDDMRNVQKQAFAGMLWGKQFYYYVVYDWLKGDPAGPKPSDERSQKGARNVNWTHLFNEDIISMPDKWEYPWFAAWDLAFHTVAFALMDPGFAKSQLRLLTREWYMHPNGQMPAYEWAFGDVNPPVHAWAAWRVYKIEKKMFGQADRAFLEEVFQKLSLYFTWWTNRKDPEGNDLFGGGFLGLDNIGPIDRSHLGSGESMEQADGTAWMSMYCLNMLEISLELAKEEPEYELMASKFFQHFLLIADAMNKIGGADVNIWDSKQQFYRDILKAGDQTIPIDVHSMVGLIPLFAVTSISEDIVEKYSFYDFKKRFDWFLTNRPELTSHENIALLTKSEGDKSNNKGAFLALVSPTSRLKPILSRMLNETEFLSDYGIRALSKIHKDPYILWVHGEKRGEVNYEPAESTTGLFGGNSNWRGPVWFPVNFLIIESLQKFYFYLGNDFTIEYPAGSGNQKNLWEISADISHRLINIFLKDETGNRPVYGGQKTQFSHTENLLQTDPNWQENILFYEYFHAENGAGLGASHQTGWTGVVAKLIQQYGEYEAQGKQPSSL